MCRTRTQLGVSTQNGWPWSLLQGLNIRRGGCVGLSALWAAFRLIRPPTPVRRQEIVCNWGSRRAKSEMSHLGRALIQPQYVILFSMYWLRSPPIFDPNCRVTIWLRNKKALDCDASAVEPEIPDIEFLRVIRGTYELVYLKKGCLFKFFNGSS